MEDGFIQQARFAQADQRRDRQPIVIRIAREMIAAVTQFLAVLADIVFDFRAFRAIGAVETVYAAAFNQIVFDPIEHHIGHFAIANTLIAVVTILIMLMQIDIVQACAAVQDAIIDNKTFEVQHAEGFPGIDRHAINRDIDAGVFLRHATVPVGIRVRCRCANTSTLGAMPVNQNANI
ncbi:Uncharacterised protein [Raoultella ornithinolytica]|nr:Uncharacterised protein [Raoultella ornithinolytica]